MKSDKALEEAIQQHLQYSGSAAAQNRVLSRAKKELRLSCQSAQRRWPYGRSIMQNRLFHYSTAAAVIAVILGGLAWWPSSDPSQSPFALPAVFGQQVLQALESVKAVTCRERTVFVFEDGRQHESSTWNTLYVSQDSYCRDIYDKDTLREIQWYLPDPCGTAFTSVRFDLKSYYQHVGPGSFGQRDPVERIRFYLNYIDDPDGILEERIIEGQTCIGFSVKASRYGNNPEHWVDRIWFDRETKLPVLIEKTGRPVTGKPSWSYSNIQDQFDYFPEVTIETLTPRIPEGFVFGHPDDLPKQ